MKFTESQNNIFDCVDWVKKPYTTITQSLTTFLCFLYGPRIKGSKSDLPLFHPIHYIRPLPPGSFLLLRNTQTVGFIPKQSGLIFFRTTKGHYQRNLRLHNEINVLQLSFHSTNSAHKTRKQALQKPSLYIHHLMYPKPRSSLPFKTSYAHHNFTLYLSLLPKTYAVSKAYLSQTHCQNPGTAATPSTPMAQIVIMHYTLLELVTSSHAPIKVSLLEQNLWNKANTPGRKELRPDLIHARETAKTNPHLASSESERKKLLSLTVE